MQTKMSDLIAKKAWNIINTGRYVYVDLVSIPGAMFTAPKKLVYFGIEMSFISPY